MHSHAQGRICAFLMHSALRKLLSCKGRWEIESLRARYFSECTREGHLNGPVSIEEITKEVVDFLRHQRLHSSDCYSI